MELSIVAHVDLPGHYRLIRIISPELAEIIRPGDSLSVPSLECVLPYFRCSADKQKIDFLFYKTDKSGNISTHSVLTDVTLEHANLTLVSQHNNTNKSFPQKFHILASNRFALGQGLAIALDDELRKRIDLFVFELDDTSPFKLSPSRLYLPYMQGNVTANIALLEEKKIAARFYSIETLEGCFCGSLNQFIGYVKSGLAKVVTNTSGCQTDLTEIVFLDETPPGQIKAPSIIEIIIST